jgi:hypothetical protein
MMPLVLVGGPRRSHRLLTAAEVQAIDASGNQTLTETTFSTG